METLENPVLKEEGEALRAMAEKLDRGEDVIPASSAQESEARTPDTTETTTEPTSSPDTIPEKKADERPRDEQGRFTKTVTGEDIPEESRQPAEAPKVEPAKAPTKEDSAYVKAQKEQERLGKTWQQVEAEKAQVRAEAQRLHDYEQQLRQQEAQIRQQTQQRQTQQAPQYSSQDYANFAAECKRQAKAAQESGDYDEALKQTTLAAEATEAALKAREFEQTAEIENAAGQYESLWVQDMNERIRQEPELANRESELAKGVMGVMQELPNFFERIPPQKLPDGRVMGGFQLAVEYYKLKQKAGMASGLEKKVKELEKQLADANGKLSIDGSGPTSPSQPRKLEDMSLDEMGKTLRQRAEQWDRAA